MIYRTLGRTGVRISAVGFGAGPVSGLMTGPGVDAQRETVRRAVEVGVNWFDTAPGYGQGQSEANLGRALADLGLTGRVHLATKVRIPPDGFDRIADVVRRSVVVSLRRLRVDRVTLFQLHNGITANRDDEPASVTPADVLGPVVEAFRRLRDEGLTEFIGLTGTGHPAALRAVIRSGAFDTAQVPYNLLNPSAGGGSADGEADYGNVLADCVGCGVGAFAIRVFAGGALVDRPPSAHTLRTPYFPLALYERDLARAERLRATANGVPMGELAVRFALAHPAVSCALIGFGSPAEVDEVAGMSFGDPS
jgi:L-galactose dehydrogenase/L-glyceraldehyde 3-phosphate reductase